MNRLITPNGGMPLELDDINFIQDAFKEAFKGVLYEFALANAGNLILGGCVKTGAVAPFNVSEGFVMLDYEILYVAAHVTNFVTSRLIVDVSYDPNGLDTFFDAVQRNTYQVRRATSYVSGSVPPIFMFHLEDNRITKIMADAIITAERIEEIVQVDTEGVRYDFVLADFSGGATPSPSSPPYAIKKNGRVVLHGGFDVPSLSVGTVYLNLPVSMRFVNITSAESNIYVCAYDDIAVRLGIGSNGTVKYFSSLGIGSATGFPISLNGVVYDIKN